MNKEQILQQIDGLRKRISEIKSHQGIISYNKMSYILNLSMIFYKIGFETNVDFFKLQVELIQFEIKIEQQPG